MEVSEASDVSSRYAWRPATPADAPALVQLEQVCGLADGHPVVSLVPTEILPLLRGKETPHASLCAFDSTGKQALALAVARRQEASVQLCAWVGPALRRQGVGSFLLEWFEGRARTLAGEGTQDPPIPVSVRCEAVRSDTDRLFVRNGYECSFAEEVLRLPLAEPPNDSFRRPALNQMPWSDATAPRFFEVYEAAFRERPGFPGWTEAEWRDWISGEGFRPDASFLALEGMDAIGFIACGVAEIGEATVGWVSQIGVKPKHRGRGIARALLLRAARQFRSEGLPSLMLTVNVNNPSSLRLCTRFGFQKVSRRAVYAKTLPSQSLEEGRERRDE